MKKAATKKAKAAEGIVDPTPATPEPPRPEDAKAALCVVQQAVDFLRGKKLWQSLKPQKISQVRSWPEGFTGAMVEKASWLNIIEYYCLFSRVVTESLTIIMNKLRLAPFRAPSRTSASMTWSSRPRCSCASLPSTGGIPTESSRKLSSSAWCATLRPSVASSS